MGRKKIGVAPQAQESFELKPFCYYCDREFDTVKTLITHQRTKHFNCAECGLKFDTVTGLRVHMLNAYKKTMKEVPNAMAGRENPDVVVHGMEGLPKGLVEERTQKAMGERAQKDKVREEESRERMKQIAAARAAEARESEEAQAHPPEAKRRAPSPPMVVPAVVMPQVSIFAQQPPPVAVPPPQPYQMLQPPPPPIVQQAPPQGSPGGGMPGLSPAVQKLLSGVAESAPQTAPIVPGLLSHNVPPDLAGLHPVALQVLAFAGGLPLKNPQRLAGK